MTQITASELTTNGATDTHVAPLLPATAPAPEPARKINFLKALLLYWLFPKRYGPHLAAGSWKRAMAAHALSLLALLAVFLPALATELDRHDPRRLREQAAYAVLTMAAQTSQNSFAWVPALFIPLGIPLAEPGLVLLAILIMPWHAGGDRAGSVFRRSLKSVYWSTTILIPVTIPVWFSFWLHSVDAYQWVDQYGELLAAGVLILFVGLPVVLWIRMLLAGGTRYVGSPDGPAFAPREPRCDECGYLIIGLPLEARCPECGLPVGYSLPGGRRQPTVWQQNELKPRGFADLVRLQWAVFADRDFFKRLPVQSGLPAARHFWWGTWLLMLLAALAVLSLLNHLPLAEAAPPEMLLGEAITAMFVPLVLQCLLMFAGCLHGQWHFGIRDYRCSAVACYYASPLIWPCVVLMIITMLLHWSPARSWLDSAGLQRMAEFWGVSGSGILHLALLLMCLAVLVFCWLRLGRALRDIQYSNV